MYGMYDVLANIVNRKSSVLNIRETAKWVIHSPDTLVYISCDCVAIYAATVNATYGTITSCFISKHPVTKHF